MSGRMFKAVLAVIFLFSCAAVTRASGEEQTSAMPLTRRAQYSEIEKEYQEGALTRTEYIQRKRDLDDRYGDERGAVSGFSVKD